MEKVGLTEEIWNTPAELLSGGQRRRVALLRALLAPAQNILLDEPFTGLDDAALEQAMRFTKQQVQNRTLILATHNRHGRIFWRAGASSEWNINKKQQAAWRMAYGLLLFYTSGLFLQQFT